MSLEMQMIELKTLSCVQNFIQQLVNFHPHETVQYSIMVPRSYESYKSFTDVDSSRLAKVFGLSKSSSVFGLIQVAGFVCAPIPLTFSQMFRLSRVITLSFVMNMWQINTALSASW